MLPFGEWMVRYPVGGKTNNSHQSNNCVIMHIPTKSLHVIGIKLTKMITKK
jgi:hypothetical protein